MAGRRKNPRQNTSELEGQSDPGAPLDSKRLLDAAKPVLVRLAEDLLARAKASPAVTAALEARHKVEQETRRTADPFAVWQTNVVDQVAAAWLLSCVFVRTLEDRGLLGQARLAGPGAADSQRQFLDLAPSLAEREYLLTVFRELSRFPAARALFDAKHNPVWLLTPSAEAAKALLGLFRLPSPEAPTFRFGQADTRFLGDLYQDLNEVVQKRYALLQTPRFVESFILDRTLERALERFGLDETTVIDPTCGSGHFLLGSFERLYDHRLRTEPGLGEREAARKALDAVYGADINPYAVAIARFRLTLAYLEKGGFRRLAEAPALPLHLVVADSLLHNAQLAQASFQELAGQSAEIWAGQAYALEDERAAREVLFRRYAAVVGNPPYITVKDASLRKLYAEIYPSCSMNYALTVPFAERFFQLARTSGSVGMITANSFMKREFGKKLVEAYLPTVNVDLIVNTSGAYIPGHGTPTVLLFGTADAPHGIDVLAVLAKRGEPTTPGNAEHGLVWRSIAEHWNQAAFENDYISVARVPRENLANHPWSLGGGGVAELKELLEERAEARLGEKIEDIGFSVIIGEDDIFIRPPAALRWRDLPKVPLVIGENVRDWSLGIAGDMLRPFDETTLEVSTTTPLQCELWPWRRVLEERIVSGSTSMRQANRRWYDVRRLSRDKHKTPLSIAFAFVATHNHFVLDRGGKVFKQTAPIIKLPETATEDDHLALLAYLNSSTVCFWLKQVCSDKGNGGIGGGIGDEAWERRFEYDGTKLSSLPIPNNVGSLVPLARRMLALAAAREALKPDRYIRGARATDRPSPDGFARAEAEDRRLVDEMARLQERIDFEVYRLFGLVDRVPEIPLTVRPGCRFFEVAMVRQEAHTAWFERHDHPRPDPNLPALGDFGLGTEVLCIERPDFKRRWTYRSWPAEVGAARNALALELLEGYVAARVEVFSGALVVRHTERGAWGGETLMPEDGERGLLRLIQSESVPYLAALRHTDAGLENRAFWEQTWDLQRAEDHGEKVAPFDPPPKYDAKDYRDPIYFRLRGKLDVPQERFISYPGCESDQDGEPVYGWAGWNHLQQAQALAALYQKRKTEEAWKADRLTPMLAGLLELLAWIKQWHNEPSEEYGGMRLGDFFEAFLDGECRSLGLTRDDLRAFRPEAKKRGKAGGRSKKAASEAAEEGDADA